MSNWGRDHLARGRNWRILWTLAIVFLAAAPAGLSTAAVSEEKKHVGLMERGFTHLENFELDKSITCLAPLVVHYGSDLADEVKRKKCAQVLALIGRSFQFDENDLASEQVFQLAHILAPDDKTIVALRAFMLSKTGRMAEADQLFQALAKDSTSNITVAICLALHYSRCSNERATRQLLLKAVNDCPDPAVASEANWILGLSLVKEREATSVAPVFERSASSAATPFLKKLRQARALMCLDKKAEAGKLCNEAGQIAPYDPSWLMGVAKTHQAASPLAGAELACKDWLAAAECRRGCTPVFILLTEYFMGRQRFDEARQCVEHWRALKPAGYEPILLSARLYNAVGKPELVEKELNTALNLNPKSSYIWTDLADLKSKTKSKAEAIEILKKATVACPNSPRIFRELGKRLLVSSKHITEAHQAFEKALSLMTVQVASLNILAKNDLADTYAGLGACEYQAGNMKEAIRYAKKFNELKFVIHLDGWLGLVHIRPDHLKFSGGATESELEHEALADMLYEMNQLDDCVKEYRLALNGDPDNIDLHSFLFFAVRDQNDWRSTMSEDLEFASKLVAKVPSELGDAFRKRFLQ